MTDNDLAEACASRSTGLERYAHGDWGPTCYGHQDQQPSGMRCSQLWGSPCAHAGACNCAFSSPMPPFPSSPPAALLPPRPPPAFEHPISPGRRRWMVVMFCLVAALLFADQNLLAPNVRTSLAGLRYYRDL